MEYILETQNLTKIYGRKEAARDVNLHIREGQIYGLIGRNGAGKTTIMRMISGLSRPSRGAYSLFGKTGLAMRMMLKNVGVLIEHPGLLYAGISEAVKPLFGEGTNIARYMPDTVMRERPLNTMKSLAVALIWGAVFLLPAIRIFDRKDVK